jgi:hypothetical protein
MGENHGRAVLRELLGELELQGLLIQGDALHTQNLFSPAPGAGAEFPLTVKGNQKTLHRQICSQFEV